MAGGKTRGVDDFPIVERHGFLLRVQIFSPTWWPGTGYHVAPLSSDAWRERCAVQMLAPIGLAVQASHVSSPDSYVLDGQKGNRSGSAFL